MKDFNEFIKLLDENFFYEIENALSVDPVVNAPTESQKRHIEAVTTAVLVLKKYHEWHS